MSDQIAAQTPSLSDLPPDELVQYGRELGLTIPEDMPEGELLRRIRDYREMLVGIDHEALLDIMVWARCPVRRSASKEALARQVAKLTCVRFEALSDRGLRALSRLRGITIFETDTREEIERRLRRSESLWSKLRRARRAAVGGLISRMVEPKSSGEYRFLPEDNSGPSLREDIRDQGVMGGIARRLRGVADDYVKEKLDEIESRIDHKLDEIDRRLSEWRDREIANRLRILKITLLVTILVAIVCLSYDLLAEWIAKGRPDRSETNSRLQVDSPPSASEDDAQPEGRPGG
jgi:hypothetical protein